MRAELAWRAGTALAPGGDLALGLRVDSAWLALEGQARAAAALPELAPEATQASLAVGVAASWAPARALAPSLGARFGFAQVSWGGSADSRYWLARAGVEAGLTGRLVPGLDLVGGLRLDLDLDPTTLRVAGVKHELSPLDLGLALGLRGQLLSFRPHPGRRGGRARP